MQGRLPCQGVGQAARGGSSLPCIPSHHADSAEVRVETREQKIHLSISDTGLGFDTRGAARQGGIGIPSMEERVRLVGGQFTIYSRHLEGTKIEVWVPIGS